MRGETSWVLRGNGDDGQSTFFNDFAYAPEDELSSIVLSNSYQAYPDVQSLLGTVIRFYVDYMKVE